MRIMRKHKGKIAQLLSVLLLAGILLTMMPFAVFAEGEEPSYLYDKDTNTAFITKKEAEWTNAEEFLASLTLSVNGTQILEPLDVVICLDRSGSMDMNYIQGDTHTASCPCLNQEHFYLKPIDGAVPDAEWIATASETDMKHDEENETLTVFNGELGEWVVLDTSKKQNFFYQFGDDGTETKPKTPLVYGAYHFSMENGAFFRISQWDTTDPRRGVKAGVWDHADEADGCYDRWSEAKDAIALFSEMLLKKNEKNNVALVPFSFRDSTMLAYFNRTDDTKPNIVNVSNARRWLIEQNNGDTNGKGTHFNDITGTWVEGDSIKGTYNSKVSWTDDISDITDMLDSLFTTPNTDYVYGLSEAYNMLYKRSPEAKEEKQAVVVFLSDGTPYSERSYSALIDGTHEVFSFSNLDVMIEPMVRAITIEDDVKEPATGYPKYWYNTGPYQRHDINWDYLLYEDDDTNKTKPVGAAGMGSRMVTVAYMLDSTDSMSRLKNMASNPASYIEINAPSSGSGTASRLSAELLNAAIFPGGRNAVLRDVISEYFYIPLDADLPDGVTVEGTIEEGQTLVWEIGDIYCYDADQEPTITVPLVLREQYRSVSSTTYYPTNADNPKPPLNTPDRGPDGPDTGSKLYYEDPSNEDRYDTIGTPKLPVYPPYTPSEPEEPKPSPTPTPTPLTVDVEFPLVRKTVSGDVPAQSEQFTFVIEAQGDAPLPASDTVTIDGSGTARFDDMTYTEAGSYTYIITEENQGATGYEYDSSEYRFVVTVTAGENELTATTKLTKVGDSGWSGSVAEFENRYVSFDVLQLVKKSSTGAFLQGVEFTLKRDDGGYESVQESNASGMIQFDIWDNGGQAGTYTLTEKAPAGYTGVGEIKIVVDNDGKITQTPTWDSRYDSLIQWNGARHTLTIVNVQHEQPSQPEPPREKPEVTLYLNKILTDETGMQVGDGKSFAVQIIDSDKNVVATVPVVANGESTVVTGLEPNAVYSMREQSGEHFTFEGFDINGGQRITTQTLTFRTTLSSNEVSGSITITLNNSSPSEEVELIDDPIPLFDWDDVDEESVYEMDSLEVPLSNYEPAEELPKTGSSETMLLALFALCLVVAGGALLRKKRPTA